MNELKFSIHFNLLKLFKQFFLYAVVETHCGLGTVFGVSIYSIRHKLSEIKNVAIKSKLYWTFCVEWKKLDCDTDFEVNIFGEREKERENEDSYCVDLS